MEFAIPDTCGIYHCFSEGSFKKEFDLSHGEIRIQIDQKYSNIFSNASLGIFRQVVTEIFYTMHLVVVL